MDFDLRQLEIFCKVVELKSFSKAADAVCLAQASVSERVANLERSLGGKLLDRLGRQVIPTRTGELLYKHAVLLLEMKRTARMELENFMGLKQGDLHLGASTIPGEYILPEIIGRFHRKYPDIHIHLSITDSSEVEALVLKGKFELGITGSRNTNETTIHHELWGDELVLAVPGQHRWARKKSIRLQELKGEPFIQRETGSGTLRIMEGYLHKAGNEGKNLLKVVARFGSSTAVKEGVKSGLGVSIISVRAIHTELKAGILKALRIEGLEMTRKFYMIRDRRRIASPPSQAFLDFLLLSAGKEP